MQYRKRLNIFQKTLVAALVMIMVLIMPELLPLLDVGGIELIFGFVILNYKNALYWLNSFILKILLITKVLSFGEKVKLPPKY